MQSAQRISEQFLAQDPGNRFAGLRSGIILLYLGRSADAVNIPQKAIKIDPHRSEGRYALGDALMREKDYAAAADQWAALAELQPRRAEAWFNLAEAFRQSGQTDRAVAAQTEYERLTAEASSSEQ